MGGFLFRGISKQLCLVRVGSDWLIPLEVVLQSVIRWLKDDEMLKTSSIWFEHFLLKLVHVV